MIKVDTSLKKDLLPRHIQLMAIAGMIGTGIFNGSSETVSLAGPSVIFAYLLGGALLLVIMASIAELAVVYPNSGIQTILLKAFGFKISFVVGWIYWINWTIVTTVEIIAAGSFLQYWFPSLPLWLLSLICGLTIFIVNCISVKYYGEIEFWFGGIKIATLLIFSILGATILFGFFTDHTVDPLANYTSQGGFFPNGWHGMFSALLVIMFSYGGSELIGVSITETRDAEKVVPKIVKGVVWRVVLFYVLPVTIICGLIPWNEVANSTKSPFVQVFSLVGLPGAAGIMNFVLLTAVLSAANAGIYATSRTVFTLAKNGEAPKLFTHISKKGVPVNALILSGIWVVLGVILSYITPDKVFNYLMSIPGITVLLNWMSICLAQVKLRPHYPKQPYFKVWLSPYLNFFTVFILAIIFVFFITNEDNIVGTIVSCIIIISLSITAVIIEKKHKKFNVEPKQERKINT
ncbi:amino acid permease [Bacillus pseudomycoides]|uniref:amino acid permease n=1 Tax=Bacillus pseudomycoides TaxID=64104 RepID=UPI000BFD78DD|nr:amino acid permease [Bacillus pseudomycoides]MED1625116.1 amino acid permease [Bacillus pseudomycoides]PHC41192.1 GABA permease (4-amino butyrate transport carrier) [Bacillus pseudomycoides]